MAGDTFPPDVNGAAKFTENLASGMAGRGHDVHVVVPASSRRHGTGFEDYGGQRVTVHRLPSYRWPPHDWLRFVLPWRARTHCTRILDLVKPDVVHFQSAVVIGRAVAIEAERRGIRLIGTNHLMIENVIEHTLLPNALRPLLARLWWADARKTLLRASAVTTPTRRAAEFLMEVGGLENVLAISCGIRVGDYTAGFGEKPERRVLFVGRVTGEKHIDVLLQAMTRLGDIGARLDVAGGGDLLKHLEHQARSLGLANRATFHGYVSDEELRRLYTESSVFAMPSIAELQSIATMEAMASGLPVVAANAMALPHLVHNGENGYLFEPGDADDLANRLRQVLTMPLSERNELGRESLRLVQMHDIDRTLELFERLYRGEPASAVARDSVNEQDRSLDGAPRTGTIQLPRRDDESGTGAQRDPHS
nr:glycosyltransferase [Pseudoclavibacter chungangensis]